MTEFMHTFLFTDNSEDGRRCAAEARRRRKSKLAALRREAKANHQVKSFSEERKKNRIKRSMYSGGTSRTNSVSSDVEDDDFTPLDPRKEAQRRERMLRNRESAALSRKRKREHTEQLEDLIAVLTAENKDLRQKIEIYENSLSMHIPCGANSTPSSTVQDSSLRRRPHLLSQQLNQAMEVATLSDPSSYQSEIRSIIPSGKHESETSSAGCFNREFAIPAKPTTEVESLLI